MARNVDSYRAETGGAFFQAEETAGPEPGGENSPRSALVGAVGACYVGRWAPRGPGASREPLLPPLPLFSSRSGLEPSVLSSNVLLLLMIIMRIRSSRAVTHS